MRKVADGLYPHIYAIPGRGEIVYIRSSEKLRPFLGKGDFAPAVGDMLS